MGRDDKTIVYWYQTDTHSVRSLSVDGTYKTSLIIILFIVIHSFLMPHDLAKNYTRNEKNAKKATFRPSRLWAQDTDSVVALN